MRYPIKEQLNDLCTEYQYNTFTDGMYSEFGSGLCDLVSRYHKKIIPHIDNLLLMEQNYSIELKSEILRQLGRVIDPPTTVQRHNILTYFMLDTKIKNTRQYKLYIAAKTGYDILSKHSENTFYGTLPTVWTKMYVRIIRHSNWFYDQSNQSYQADVFNDLKTVDDTLSVFKIKNIDELKKILEDFSLLRDEPSRVDYVIWNGDDLKKIGIDICYVSGTLGTDSDLFHRDIKNLTAKQMFNLTKIKGVFGNFTYNDACELRNRME